MEKAIEIKRRAQRCIQSGDLDGALAEYEKLVGFEDSDPYNYVLLADLLYKKGEQQDAADRYLSAVAAYEKASLYKNAIAVCKKMTRLSLSPAKVLKALASLHALDGLAGEAALYYVQYAEHMVRSSSPAEAANALRKAFDVCQDNIKVLEQLSEAWLLSGDQHQAAQALVEAAQHYKLRGQDMDAQRCSKRAAKLDASVPVDAEEPAEEETPAAVIEREATPPAIEQEAPPPAIEQEAPPPGIVPEPEVLDRVDTVRESVQAPESHMLEIEPTARTSMAMARPDLSGRDVEGFDSGRHDVPGPATGGDEPEDAVSVSPGASPSDFAASEADLGAYATAEAAGDEEPGVNGDGVQFVIDEDSLAEPISAGTATDGEDDSEGEAVYEIDVEEDETPAYAVQAESAAEAEAEDGDDVVVIDEDPTRDPDVAVVDEEPEAEPGVLVIDEQPGADAGVAVTGDAPAAVPQAAEPVSKPAPGLNFRAPAAAPAPHHTGHAAHASHSSAHHGPNTHEIGLQQVEALLTQAQEQFRAGDRETASATLARAAQAYEILGRFDSAATIYRSLGRSANVSHSVLELWLVNCERRGDAKEAATVACEMGDRALNGGDDAEARRWFERAVSFDAANEIAKRRLQRLASGGATGGSSVAVASAAPAGAPPVEGGRVEVAVGRGEAVTFDLSGLLAEFQRGVEAQLAGDAQSHYDLGMTYREMGLLEQAVDSFRVAVGEPRLAARALEMIGRCHADQTRWAEAVGEFRRALQQPIPEGGDGELRFHFAHALVELGESAEALAEYEKVAAQMPGYEDVDERIAALRRVLGRA